MIGVHFSRAVILPHIPMDIYIFENLVLSKDLAVMIAFASLMIFASYSMIKNRVVDSQMFKQTLFSMILIALKGLLVGMTAGFVGAGGGFLIIPALVAFAGLTMKYAIGTSLMIIALQSLVGFVGDVLRGQFVDWSLLGRISLITTIGIFIGTAVARGIKEQNLKTAFGWFILLMGTVIFIEQLSQYSLK